MFLLLNHRDNVLRSSSETTIGTANNDQIGKNIQEIDNHQQNNSGIDNAEDLSIINESVGSNEINSDVNNNNNSSGSSNKYLIIKPVISVIIAILFL